MCRIMFSRVTQKDRIWHQDIYRYLEKSLGGDGNGVAFIRDKKLGIAKGRNMTPAMCVDEALRSDDGLTLFHTRRASVGDVTTDNSQPFFVNNHTALVQNGTWSEYKLWAKLLFAEKRISIKEFRSLTDAKVAALMSKEMGLDFLWMANTGVFVAFDAKLKRALLYCFSGDFECILHRNRYFYASEFDQIYKHHWQFTSGTIAVLSIDKESGYEILQGSVREKKDNFRTFVASTTDFSDEDESHVVTVFCNDTKTKSVKDVKRESHSHKKYDYTSSRNTDIDNLYNRGYYGFTSSNENEYEDNTDISSDEWLKTQRELNKRRVERQDRQDKKDADEEVDRRVEEARKTPHFVTYPVKDWIGSIEGKEDLTEIYDFGHKPLTMDNIIEITGMTLDEAHAYTLYDVSSNRVLILNRLYEPMFIFKSTCKEYILEYLGVSDTGMLKALVPEILDKTSQEKGKILAKAIDNSALAQEVKA